MQEPLLAAAADRWIGITGYSCVRYEVVENIVGQFSHSKGTDTNTPTISSQFANEVLTYVLPAVQVIKRGHLFSCECDSDPLTRAAEKS